VTVILKNLFKPDDFLEDFNLFNDLEADILAECTKLGPVEKVCISFVLQTFLPYCSLSAPRMLSTSSHGNLKQELMQCKVFLPRFARMEEGLRHLLDGFQYACPKRFQYVCPKRLLALRGTKLPPSEGRK
jgi:hypothetical protein